ncbi:GFA family protein [Vibrio hippocampi]|uniref:CENP-V/GFA domain-containing protein n=1 Tax=Vibrio hippocampi TaxID=654686 RepID=A0ABN8DIZ6_9VIBR|nr:aldehyde-activating protein [Vibrio hippocampi]CAH0525887.1 hypothetical protein VHP8226_01384 [Vibrio hippocampi]
MTKQHNVQCHCGNITLSYQQQPEHLTRCNCSLCRRYAALWGYFRSEEVKVTVENGKLNRYCWGDKEINFSSCSICGSVTHYSSVAPTPESRLAINFRMADKEVVSHLPIRLFDGADSWQIISIFNPAEFDQ